MYKIGIIIPTKNRFDFLIRQLLYYSAVGSPHTIYVGDASDNPDREAFEGRINSIKNIKIKFFHWPDKNDRQTIAGLARLVSEEYCAFVGDDDFLVPNSLSKAAAFLASNPEYRTAQGKGILFSIKDSGAFGLINSLGAYWERKDAEENSAEARLLNFGENYWVPQFSIHRTSEFVEDCFNYDTMEDKSFGELLHSFSFIAKGKSRYIDCLYLFRQSHDARYTLPDIFDWVTSSKWNSSYRVFRDTLVSSLMEADGILDEEKARDAIKRAFWGYLSKASYNKYQGKYNRFESLTKDTNDFKSIPPANVFERLKKISRIQNVKQFLTKNKLSSAKKLGSFRKGEELIKEEQDSRLSLSELLQKSSPYYEDFMPVYKSITANEENSN